MKIQKITLYLQNLIETDGEYAIEPTDVEEVPCVITNRALSLCRDYGIGETGLIQDFVTTSTNTRPQPDGSYLMAVAGDEQILKAIYVGYVGGQILLGKAEPDYTYDEFIERYHGDVSEKFNLYQALIVSPSNEFVKNIEKSTDKAVKKGEKK